MLACCVGHLICNLGRLQLPVRGITVILRPYEISLLYGHYRQSYQAVLASDWLPSNWPERLEFVNQGCLWAARGCPVSESPLRQKNPLCVIAPGPGPFRTARPLFVLEILTIATSANFQSAWFTKQRNDIASWQESCTSKKEKENAKRKMGLITHR